MIQNLSTFSPDFANRLAVQLFLSPIRYPRTPEEEQFWQTGAGEKFLSGCRGRVFGDGDKTVWVVHGWESRGSKFKVFIEALVKAGFRVVAWDAPAHGDSKGQRTNMVRCAQELKMDVERFMPGQPLHALVGHSFGAGVAGYACRLDLNVHRLVLISAPCSVRPVFVRFWQAIGLPESLKPNFIAAVEKETGVTISQISLENYIDKLPQKIQIIHDKSDKEIPFSEAEILKNKSPAAVLVGTEKLGHRRILDSQIVASLLVKFLTYNEAS